MSKDKSFDWPHTQALANIILGIGSIKRDQEVEELRRTARHQREVDKRNKSLRVRKRQE